MEFSTQDLKDLRRNSSDWLENITDTLSYNLSMLGEKLESVEQKNMSLFPEVLRVKFSEDFSEILLYFNRYT